MWHRGWRLALRWWGEPWENPWENGKIIGKPIGKPYEHVRNGDFMRIYGGLMLFHVI